MDIDIHLKEYTTPKWNIPNEKIWPDKKWVKHVRLYGARFHVISYHARFDFAGVKAYMRCSETNCIYNAPKEIQDEARAL